MFLHFGTKENTLSKEDYPYKCEYCKSNGTTFLFVNNKYVHFWYLPLFQYSKKVYFRCGVCDNLKVGENIPFNYKFKAIQLLKRTKTPLVHYAGTFMFVFVVISLVVKFNFDSKEDKLLLQKPLPGDVYWYKISQSNYTLLKVVSANNDSVFVLENKYVTNKFMNLYDIDSDEFYSNQTYGIAMKELSQMYEEGEIIGVKRKEISLQTEILKRLP